MQYFRSLAFNVFLVVWTLVLGLATPVLMAIGNRKLVRSYALFWARGVATGIRFIIGLRYRIEGNLPNLSSPKIIVSNHQSMWETILLAILMDNVTFVAKRELTKVPIFGWYMKNFPMVLVDRGNRRVAIASLMEEGAKAIAEGRSIVIFPEGTRIAPDENKKFHYGVAALYSKLNIPAVAVAHNSGCFWNDEYSMKYAGEVTLKVIEEIPAGLPADQFMRKCEDLIVSEKNKLRDKLEADDWRWALG